MSVAMVNLNIFK